MSTPRRTLLKAMATASALAGSASSVQANPNPRVRRIATEEGFNIPRWLVLP